MQVKTIVALTFLLLCCFTEAWAQSDTCANGDQLVLNTSLKRYQCITPGTQPAGTGTTMLVANETVTGTTVNRLAKLTGAPSKAIITATTDTENAVGIVTSGAGITGNATITILGQASCEFDGATTAGNYFIISATTAGKCHDAGSGFPTSGATYGRVLSTNGAAGTYVVELMTPDIAFQNAGNGKSKPGTPTNSFQFNNSSQFGGTSGLSWDDTNKAATLAQGTLTTSNPFFTHTATFNSGAVTFINFSSNITDTNSNTGSLAFRQQVGGTTMVQIRKKNSGIWGIETTDGSNSVPAISSISAPTTGITWNETTNGISFVQGGGVTARFGSGEFQLGNSGISQLAAGYYRWASSTRIMPGGPGAAGQGIKIDGNSDDTSNIGIAFGSTIAAAPALARNGTGNTAKFVLGDGSALTYFAAAGNKFVATQFDKTNTTLANVTDLVTESLVSGKTYAFEANLFVDADVTGGSKYAIAGTATATTIKYYVEMICDATNLLVITSRQTALAGSAGQAGCTAGLTRISGTITVNAAGTLAVQFAQNAANGTSSVLTMSKFEVRQLN